MCSSDLEDIISALEKREKLKGGKIELFHIDIFDDNFRWYSRPHNNDLYTEKFNLNGVIIRMSCSFGYLVPPVIAVTVEIYISNGTGNLFSAEIADILKKMFTRHYYRFIQ